MTFKKLIFTVCTIDYWENRCNSRVMKYENVNFVHNDVQSILSSHKISEKYDEQVFYKKTLLKTFVIFTGKHLCQSLMFNKMQARPATSLKRDSNTGVSLTIPGWPLKIHNDFSRFFRDFLGSFPSTELYFHLQ